MSISVSLLFFGLYNKSTWRHYFIIKQHHAFRGQEKKKKKKKKKRAREKTAPTFVPVLTFPPFPRAADREV